MRISSRPRVALTIIGTLALAIALAAPSGVFPTAGAAAQTATANYTGTHTKLARIASGSGLPAASKADASSKHLPQIIPYRTPGAHDAFHASTAIGHGVPQVGNSTLMHTSEGHLLHNFNGLSDLDQATANGGVGNELTPPDQGLCAGFLPPLSGMSKSSANAKVVWEIINSAVVIYAPNGTVLAGPISLTAFFHDPNSIGDVRCFYDSPVHTFYFTQISSNRDLTNSRVDLVVINAHGFAEYQVDTTLGGQCFGDQPHVGYDSHALYISTDEFCGPPNFNSYNGAILFGLSKPQLVAESTVINGIVFGPLSLGSIPILTLEPAFGDASGVEYLLNSFPFDQFGNNNSISNTLGFWEVHGDASLTTGKGHVSLSGRTIHSELYAFPVPAASTGTGTVTCVPFIVNIPPCTTGIPVLSEKFLNPDDDRMLQVQLVDDNRHGLRLFAALDTAVALKGDPSDRDGAAWFELNPKSGKITDQGYVAVKGAYLLYPAILHTEEGTTALAFTITSPTINPSAADAVWKSNRSSFGAVQIVAAGSSPHVSFAGPLFNQTRWGDYSAEGLDPNGRDIWSATEYIPTAVHQDPIDNWGTRIWDVMGDH